MKKPSNKLTPICATLLLTAIAAFAGYTTVLTYSGDPNSNVSAEVGTLCSDISSAGGIYVKTGTTASSGWVKISTDALGNGLRGTVALTSGTGIVTNSAITTSSRVLVTPSGTTNAGNLGTTVATGTLIIQSTGASDARTVTYLIFNP